MLGSFVAAAASIVARGSDLPFARRPSVPRPVPHHIAPSLGANCLLRGQVRTATCMCLYQRCGFGAVAALRRHGHAMPQRFVSKVCRDTLHTCRTNRRADELLGAVLCLARTPSVQ